jgi:MarR family transcriptional regulator, negative regulator of the multidrug operon emrRAB
VADQGHLGNVLGALALALVTEMETAAQEATGLPIVDATALSALANLGDGTLSVEGVRRTVDLSQPATVRLIDRLVARGLVRRGGQAGDRRVTTVRLTAAGRRTVSAFRDSRTAVVQRWITRLSPADRDILAPLLDALVAVGIEPAPEGAAEADYRCRWCDPPACGHPDACPVTQAVRATRLT